MSHVPSRTSPAAVLLTVPGAPWARVAAHAVTALAVLNVPLSLTIDLVAAAVAFLVVGGLTLARVLALPGALQAPLGLSLILAAWAGALGLYQEITWIDVPVHFVVNGLIAAALAVVLLRAGVLSDSATRAGRIGIALTTTGVGAALAAGTLGSAVAGVLLARWVARRESRL